MNKVAALLVILVIFGALVCGCTSSDTKSADLQNAPAAIPVAATPTTTQTTVTPPQPTATPKFAVGDIVAYEEDQAFIADLILDFNESSQQYLYESIFQNSDGSWGHTLLKNDTHRDYRENLEKYSPYVIGHVNPDKIPGYDL